MKFREASNLYLKHQKIRNSKATYSQAKGYLKRSNMYLGNMNCEDIDSNTMYDFIEHRRKVNPRVSNTTLNKYIRFISSVLKDELDIILKFKKLRQDRKIPQVLDEITIHKVFRYLDKFNIPEHQRNKVMFSLLLDTGLRISELINVKVNDINFQQNMILVKHTKIKSERIVLFTNETKKLLNDYIVMNRIRDYIIINLETREKLHPDSIQTICQRIQTRIGTKQSITPHKWRHTFATNFTDNNGNMFVLQKLLGHQNIATTQLYVTVSMKKTINEYFRVVENSVK